MNMRNFFLTIMLFIVGNTIANEVETQIYQQEFAEIQKNPELAHLFEKDIYQEAHTIERQIQNFIAIPNKWHRFACCLFLNQDVIVATRYNMPHLYKLVDELAKKAEIKTPYIFISIHEGTVNAFAAKYLNGIGGILIDQKALNTLTDMQLNAVIAHELGHIKFEHVNKTLALLVPTFFVSLYLSHKAMNFAKSHMPNNTVSNWGYWMGGYLRYIGMHEYSVGLLSAGLMTYLTKSFIIGKKFEKQADAFAHELGHAHGMIEFVKVVDQQYQKADAQLIAATDKVVNARENLATEDFNELQQGAHGQRIILSFVKWLKEKTSLFPHPSKADRIAAAQAYLDAQVPAIEKA